MQQASEPLEHQLAFCPILPALPEPSLAASKLRCPPCFLIQVEEVNVELIDAFVASLNHHGIRLEVVELDDKGGLSAAQGTACMVQQGTAQQGTAGTNRYGWKMMRKGRSQR